MAYNKKLEFGNYTLKFGDNKVLLDFFEEIVMPSFHEMKYQRNLRGKTKFFFLDTELIVLDKNPKEPVLGISGRIVKVTNLRREQIFNEDNGLVEDKKELETAPSSTFLLILNTHRLILCREVPGAPTIKNFQSTSQYFLNLQREKFINDSFEEAKDEKELHPEKERVTKKFLREQYPKPTLRITPLSDKQSLRQFLNQLRQVDKVSIRLLPTNKEEIDNDDFWSDFGRRRDEMNSKKTRVEFTNTQEGLNKKEVYEQAHSASGMGNSEINFKGYDKAGDTIKGTNEDFSLTVELEDLPRATKLAAEAKYQQFNHLVGRKVIKIPKIAKSTLRKILKIFGRM